MNPTTYDPSVTTRLDDDPRSWAPMDPELMRAACDGNVEFLKKDSVSSKHQDYWLSRTSRFIPTPGKEPCAGNMFHLAVWNNRKEFVTRALSVLRDAVVQQLLTQRETAEKLSNSTPALLAIRRRAVGCAKILTEGSRAELIKNLLDDDGNSPLFLAVQNGLPEVALNLLRCQPPLSCRGPTGSTALHILPQLSLYRVSDKCFAVKDKPLRDVSKELFQLITVTEDYGLTILHQWVKIFFNSRGSLDAGAEKRIKEQFEKRFEEQFEHFFQHYRGDAVRLMLATDDRNDGNNPLHCTAKCTYEDAAILIAGKLIDLYKKYLPELSAQTPKAAPEEQKAASDASTLLQNHDPPWLMKNNNGDTPFLLAIHNKLKNLASRLLSEDPVNSLSSLGNQKNPLVLAAENEWDGLAKEIIDVIDRDKKGLNSLLNFSDGSNILHSASTSNYPASFVIEVVNRFPELVEQHDGTGDTPLDKASKNDAACVVECILKTHPSPLKSSPSAWINACKDGRLSVVRAFVESSMFRDFCGRERDTPLHHIKLKSVHEYRNFLISNKFIKKHKNTQNKDGATPLHKAIERGDRELAEALLKAGADYTIQNEAEKTAMDLIAEKCRGDKEWRKWCERVKIDPVLKKTFAQRSEYLLKLREVLSVVATLLAAITFQAGFTLPGGLNQNSGEAILAKNAAFLVFLLADAIAMWCSLLVLFCLIWSMFCDSEKSATLIDRSMWILLASLYSSLVAFVSGVFTVIHHGSLWAIIIIIVSCSFLGLLAIEGEICYLILNQLPATSTERRLCKWLNTLRGKVSTLMDNISKKLGRKAYASMNKSSEVNSTQEHAVQIKCQED